MQSIMYWLDVEGDRTGLDVRINDVPALHLLESGGTNLPINEYLVQGENRVDVRRGVFPSNAAAEDAGEIALKLLRKQFQGTSPVTEHVLVDVRSPFDKAPPGVPLATASFRVDDMLALPDLAGFAPVTPALRPLVIAQLDRLADVWRRKDGEALLAWMDGYLHDYARAYPLETLATMRDRTARMMAGLTRGRWGIDYDPAQVRLDPCGDGRLLDCLSPAGAAIRLLRPGMPPYDFWTVVGVRDGKVVLVR